ncbi:MAG: hypothetical protein AAF410_02165 [Pseudomonadota bacterium]
MKPLLLIDDKNKTNNRKLAGYFTINTNLVYTPPASFLPGAVQGNIPEIVDLMEALAVAFAGHIFPKTKEI